MTCTCPPMHSCPRHGIKNAPARGKGLTRTKGVKQQTVKQKELEARWAGIKEATIYWLERLDPDGPHCFDCGSRKGPFDLDHIIPRSRGGKYTTDNAQLLCRPCHQTKHGRPEWSSSTENRPSSSSKPSRGSSGSASESS